MKNLGIILMVVGLTATLFTGFTLITQRKVFNVGRIEINREDKTPIYWSPISGIIILGAGAILFLMSKKSR